jgi:hypothetical protein
MNKIIMRGDPKAIKLLKRILEVLLIKINKSRKDRGLEELVQIG